MSDKENSEELEILQIAKNLMDKHGKNAVAVAMSNMQDSMQDDKIKQATKWLAIAHEIESTGSKYVG